MRSRWIVGLSVAGALALAACSSDDRQAPAVTPAGTAVVTSSSAGGVAPTTAGTVPSVSTATTATTGISAATTASPPATLGAINGPAQVETTTVP